MDRQALALKYLERFDLEESTINAKFGGPYLLCTTKEMVELDQLFHSKSVYYATVWPDLGDTYYERIMNALCMVYAGMDADGNFTWTYI